jgi:hypothetical protein
MEEIKSKKKKEIEKLAVSPLRIKLKKIGYLLKGGMPLNKFIKYSFAYIFIIPLKKIKTSIKGRYAALGMQTAQTAQTAAVSALPSVPQENAVNKADLSDISGIINSGVTNRIGIAGSGGTDADTCFIAVNIGNAGIGDAIVAIRFLKILADYLYAGGFLPDNNFHAGNFTDGNFTDGGFNGKNFPHGGIVFDIFYRSPDSIKFITSPHHFIRRLMNLTDYSYLHKYYDIDLKLNTFFIKAEINSASEKKLSEKFQPLLKIIDNIKTNQKPIEKYIKTRPFSEGILAEAVTDMGLSRESYLNWAAGIRITLPSSQNTLFDKKATYNKIAIETDPAALSKFGLKGVKLITVHDGWDENTKIRNKSKISTKSYPHEKWNELIKLLKLNFPQYTTAQLGGLGNGSDIEGVDLNLRGKTSLKEAASVISEASLHIDTDSGLVHIAACVGTVCAVIFGPTNAHYCSYSKNINIPPRICGNCWWSADDWMNACPKGLNAPECMNSIEPNDIIKEIKQKK